MKGDLLSMEISISSRRVPTFLLFIVAPLLIAGLAVGFVKHVLGHGTFLGLARLFILNGEANVPTWFSSMELGLCAGLLALVAMAEKQKANRFWRHWMGLEFIFTFLSMDETAQIHEWSSSMVQMIPHLHHFTGAWHLPYVLTMLVLGYAYLPFLAHLPAATRRFFILSGIAYVGGAFGMEFIEQRLEDLHLISGMPLYLMETLGEAGEMLGLVLFAYSLLSYLRDHVTVIRLRFDDCQTESMPAYRDKVTFDHATLVETGVPN